MTLNRLKMFACVLFCAAIVASMTVPVQGRTSWYDENECETLDPGGCSYIDGVCWGGDGWPDNCYDPGYFFEFLNWCNDYCENHIYYAGSYLSGCFFTCQCESCG